MEYSNFTTMTLNENSQLILTFLFALINATPLNFTEEHYGYWIEKFRNTSYPIKLTPDTKSDLAYFQALIIKDSNIWSYVQSKIEPGYLMMDQLMDVKSSSNLVCVNDLSLRLLHIDLNSSAPNCTMCPLTKYLKLLNLQYRKLD